MANQVRVTSLDALETFRAHLIIFLAKAVGAVDEVGDEVRRTRSWVHNDQRQFWETQIKKRRRILDQAQGEYMNARLSKLQDNIAAQKQAVQKAKRELEEAEQKLEDDRWEVIEIRRLQRFYEIESKKIESAYSEMRNPFLFSAFVSELGRSLPERMVVDTIEFGDGKFIIHGRLREASERASLLLGDYLDKLRTDPELGPHFTSINVTGLDRSLEDEQMMTYAITMHLKPKPK